MSSHHFVREGQEPALLIVDPVSLTLVEPLLEWAPVVIVLDNAIADVLKWKIKIDVVLFQQHSIPADAEEISYQGPVEILFYKRAEDIPGLIVTFLAQRKCRGVHVIAKPSTDLFDRWLLNVNKCGISVIDQHTKWSAIQSTFQKWLPEKTNLIVQPSQGASFKYTGITYSTGQSFLTEKDGVVFIQSDEPFWLGEPLEN